MTKTTKWSPPETSDFYRGRIKEATKLMQQLERDYAKLQKRISIKNKYATHQTELYIAGKKKAYDAMIHTLQLDIRECERLIKWVETGIQPRQINRRTT